MIVFMTATITSERHKPLFDYQPYTPPMPEKRSAGQPPRPSIHTDAVAANLAEGPDVWRQFTIGPRGANPNDPYDGNIGEHTRDLARAARHAGHRINYGVLNALTGEKVPTTVRAEDGTVTTADQVLTEQGIPAVITFNAKPKRV